MSADKQLLEEKLAANVAKLARLEAKEKEIAEAKQRTLSKIESIKTSLEEHNK